MDAAGGGDKKNMESDSAYVRVHKAIWRLLERTIANAVSLGNCCYQFIGIGMKPCKGQEPVLPAFHALDNADFEV